MNIGLIDVDGHNFPNLALMKLSAYHKFLGDEVGWYSGIERYDRVYMSKVFSFTPDDYRVIQADEVIRGGTGYKMYDQQLSDDIEHFCPDYSLYPMFSAAYGFLTRGCVNKCSFCIVPRKEGVARPHADITEFLDGRKEAVLMDNNVISTDWGLSQIEKIISLKVKVDFNQGIDARIIASDREIAKLLARVKWSKYIRMAYDNSAVTEHVKTAIEYLKEAGLKPWRMMFYVLAKDGELDDAEKRAILLDNMGCQPFAMPYRDLNSNNEPTNEQKRFARWCNMKSTFRSCSFNEYKY